MSKNLVKGSAAVWIIVALLAVIIAGGGYYLLTQGVSTGGPAPLGSENGGGQAGNREFPWKNYPAVQELETSKAYDVVVASRVVMNTKTKARIVVAQKLEMGTGAEVTGSAYIFDSIDLGTNARIGILYYEAGTDVDDAYGTAVDGKQLLAHNDLVTAASSASATTGQTGEGGLIQGSGDADGVPAPNPGPAPVPAASQTSPFVGMWSGSFIPNPSSRANGCPGGAVAFTVVNNGTFQGPVTTENGDIYYGGGTVAASGNLNATWHIGDGNVVFSGKLSGNTGSGTYADDSGCSGSFTLKR